MSRAELVKRIKAMDERALRDFATAEQAWANRLQSLAAASQSVADAARKEIKRRSREDAA